MSTNCGGSRSSCPRTVTCLGHPQRSIEECAAIGTAAVGKRVAKAPRIGVTITPKPGVAHPQVRRARRANGSRWRRCSAQQFPSRFCCSSIGYSPSFHRCTGLPTRRYARASVLDPVSVVAALWPSRPTPINHTQRAGICSTSSRSNAEGIQFKFPILAEGALCIRKPRSWPLDDRMRKPRLELTRPSAQTSSSSSGDTPRQAPPRQTRLAQTRAGRCLRQPRSMIAAADSSGSSCFRMRRSGAGLMRKERWRPLRRQSIRQLLPHRRRRR